MGNKGSCFRGWLEIYFCIRNGTKTYFQLETFVAKSMKIISIAVLPRNNDERICNLFQLFSRVVLSSSS